MTVQPVSTWEAKGVGWASLRSTGRPAAASSKTSTVSIHVSPWWPTTHWWCPGPTRSSTSVFSSTRRLRLAGASSAGRSVR